MNDDMTQEHVARTTSNAPRGGNAQLLLAAIVDSSDDAIIGKTLDGIITTWNLGATRIFGYSESEMIGRSMKLLVPPERVDEESNILRRIARGENIKHFETIRLGKDGSRIEISATISPVTDATGKIIGASNIARVIDERKRLLRTLQESEERFRRLFESAKDGILILDFETGSIEDVNPFLIELLGMEKKEFLRKKVWELGFFVHLIANEDKFRELQQKDYVRYENFPLEARDGRRIDVEFVSNVYEVEGTKVIQCNIRDITERIQMEKLLRIQDRAMQSTSEGIIIADACSPDFPMIYANKGFESITGYSVAEAIGRNCRFLQGPDTDPSAVASLREAIRTLKPVTVELLNYRKDGTSFWNKLSISPVCNESGNLTHFVGIQFDVTGHRRTEEQLRQSGKMEAIGHLAGGIAHDFNNILTVIDCYANMSFDELVPTDPAWKLLKKIQSASALLAGLTHHLIAFSRRQVTSPEPLDVNFEIIETVSLLNRIIGKELELDIVLAPDLKNIWMDRVQISQILMNLAINARDAMASGGRLSFRTENRKLNESKFDFGLRIEPGDYIVLTVADTGNGMSAEILTRIFEPFYTTKPLSIGSGLGLAFVYAIVGQSHGCIEIDSEVGIGTAFRIFLPVLSTSLQISDPH